MGSKSIKYLLDTHTWVWWNMRPQNLSLKIRKLIENEEGYDELLLSEISTSRPYPVLITPPDVGFIAHRTYCEEIAV